ncbi:MAG: hypothetical protein HON68_09465 [Gammaproteobacteria bacterium]|nr:hypothetical protein [Gammaproteobacteria bacterium]MBT3488311.1 hypothetical protein [Gammaproteobacteria bacterium]MBT3718411.1 hypothetical protein [Gammaproteobacteria bacterium]MBT3844850.1 hypothetical protein [Gammaproteobacteria bacterium]MBT3894354.1 hypothetical protein [Gammaproteobacteria bacterium]
MDLIKTIETASASASAANEAAETALLATEGIVSLSSRVSDDVRNSVQQAIRAASPPRRDPDESDQSLGDSAPLIVSALTLCGVLYLAMENSTLTEQLNDQLFIVTSLEEQMSSEENITLMMTLAESSQRIEESLMMLSQQSSGKNPATDSEIAETATETETETETETTLAMDMEATSATPLNESEMSITPIESLPAKENTAQLLTALEQINHKLDTLQNTLSSTAHSVALTEPQQSTTAVTASTRLPGTGVTVETLRTTLQQELVPLQQTIKIMGSEFSQQFTTLQTLSLPQQPALEGISFDVQSETERTVTKKKPRAYRFP